MLIFTSWGSSPLIWSISHCWQNPGSFFSQLGQRNLSPTETGLATHIEVGGTKHSCSSSTLARKEPAVDLKPVFKALLCLIVLYWEANKCPWERSGGHLLDIPCHKNTRSSTSGQTVAPWALPMATLFQCYKDLPNRQDRLSCKKKECSWRTGDCGDAWQHCPSWGITSGHS